MAKPDYNLCDICTEQTYQSISLTIGTEADPSGNGHEPVTRFWDLCPRCLTFAARRIFNKSHETAADANQLLLSMKSSVESTKTLNKRL